MTLLREHLRIARREYHTARYPGDLADDVLPRGLPLRRRAAWLRPLIAGMAAAAAVAVVVYIYRPEPSAAVQGVAAMKDPIDALKQVAQSTGLWSASNDAEPGNSQQESSPSFRIVPGPPPMDWSPPRPHDDDDDATTPNVSPVMQESA